MKNLLLKGGALSGANDEQPCADIRSDTRIDVGSCPTRKILWQKEVRRRGRVRRVWNSPQRDTHLLTQMEEWKAHWDSTSHWGLAASIHKPPILGGHAYDISAGQRCC